MNRKRIAMVLALCIALAGCTKTGTVQTTPATSQALSEFESYVAQTSFSFPQSWVYDEEDEEDVGAGLQAAFTFEGGTIALQFLWMDQGQADRNVFLQQIDMNNVQEQALNAGPYTGKIISGVENATYIIAFEGCRDWYAQSAKLYLRVVLSAANEAVFAEQRANLMAMLSSVSVSSDTAPAAIEAKAETYDFKDEFGLFLQAPSVWMLNPKGDAEHQSITLSFSIADGDNLFRVQLATVEQKEYDELVASLKTLSEYEDVYGYTFSEKSGVIQVFCMQEGKINRMMLTRQKTGGKIRYLLTNSMLRPVLDSAYYQSAVAPVIKTIQWKQ